MKSKTIWYVCLALILFGGFLVDNLNQILGIAILGLSAYTAGAYHMKFRLEGADEKTNRKTKLLQKYKR